MAAWLSVRIMFTSGAKCLPADCCISYRVDVHHNKTLVSNILRTTRFYNNLHNVSSKSNDLKAKLFIYVLSSVLWCYYDFCIQRYLVVSKRAHVTSYACVFDYSGVQHTLCFFSSCVPYYASFSGLSLRYPLTFIYSEVDVDNVDICFVLVLSVWHKHIYIFNSIFKIYNDSTVSLYGNLIFFLLLLMLFLTYVTFLISKIIIIYFERNWWRLYQKRVLPTQLR